MSHLLVDPGWVDLDFDCSTVCYIMPGLMADAAGQDGGISKYQSQPSLSARTDDTPCTCVYVFVQWSVVRVTAVIVTVGYSDSFSNPRFI